MIRFPPSMNLCVMVFEFRDIHGTIVNEFIIYKKMEKVNMKKRDSGSITGSAKYCTQWLQ